MYIENEVGGNGMLKTFRILLSIIVFGLASYSLITQNFEFMPYMLFALGVLSLITGITELKAERKTSAILSILAAAFVLFVAIYTF